jgi:hypothetical protein
VAGQLGYYQLGNWWMTAFDEAERAHIERVYQPMGFGLRPLTQGNITASTGTVVMFLSGLAGWCTQENDRLLARRILAKAEELATTAPILDVHFLYQAKMQAYYRDNRDPAALAVAIHACEQQIAVAPQAAKAMKKAYRGQPLPTHSGYDQLIAIRQRQQDYSAAIALARQAQKQGWRGDWDKDIAQCQKGQAKQDDKAKLPPNTAARRPRT